MDSQGSTAQELVPQERIPRHLSSQSVGTAPERWNSSRPLRLAIQLVATFAVGVLFTYLIFHSHWFWSR